MYFSTTWEGFSVLWHGESPSERHIQVIAKKNKDLCVCYTNKVRGSICSGRLCKTRTRKHLSFNNLPLPLTHAHTRSHVPFNVCLLKWSLMRCEPKTAALSSPPLLPPSPSHSLLNPLRATGIGRESDKDTWQAACSQGWERRRWWS